MEFASTHLAATMNSFLALLLIFTFAFEAAHGCEPALGPVVETRLSAIMQRALTLGALKSASVQDWLDNRITSQQLIATIELLPRNQPIVDGLKRLIESRTRRDEIAVVTFLKARASATTTSASVSEGTRALLVDIKAFPIQNEELSHARLFETPEGRVLLVATSESDEYVIYAPRESPKPIFRMPMGLGSAWHMTPSGELLLAFYKSEKIVALSPLRGKHPFFTCLGTYNQFTPKNILWHTSKNGETSLAAIHKKRVRVFKPFKSEKPVWMSQAIPALQLAKFLESATGELYLQATQSGTADGQVYKDREFIFHSGGDEKALLSEDNFENRAVTFAIASPAPGKTWLGVRIQDKPLSVYWLEKGAALEWQSDGKLGNSYPVLEWIAVGPRLLLAASQDDEVHLYEPLKSKQPIFIPARADHHQMGPTTWYITPDGHFNLARSLKKRSDHYWYTELYRPLEKREPVWKSSVQDPETYVVDKSIFIPGQRNDFALLVSHEDRGSSESFSIFEPSVDTSRVTIQFHAKSLLAPDVTLLDSHNRFLIIGHTDSGELALLELNYGGN